MLQKQEFQPRAFSIFAQMIGIAEQFAHSFCDRDDLLPAHEGVEPHSKMRIGGKAAANANREPGLFLSVNFAQRWSKSQVVDLRITAPIAAAADRDLVLARQVVEIGVTDEK